MKKTILISLFVTGLVLTSCSIQISSDDQNKNTDKIAVQNENPSDVKVDQPLVGNDKDLHGCIGSAGYSWCELKNKCLRPWEEKCENTPAPQTLSYVISKEDTTKYCNGADMDSEGYKKTISNEVTTNTLTDSMTTNELAKAIVLAATTGQCQTVLQETDITINGDTVNVAAMEGWAGSSIIMCSCKPLIEVNLLRMTGITKVIFE